MAWAVVTPQHEPPVPAGAADAGPRPAPERRGLAPWVQGSVPDQARGSVQAPKMLPDSVQALKSVPTSAHLALPMSQVERHRSEMPLARAPLQDWARDSGQDLDSVQAPKTVLELVEEKAPEQGRTPRLAVVP